MEDLQRVAYDYLAGLPASIRSDIIVFVLIYCFDYAPSDLKLIEALEPRLMAEEKSGLGKFAALLRVVGATDHLLARYIKTAMENEYALPAMQQHPLASEAIKFQIERMKISREFSLAHAEQAQQQWLSLRNSTLSPASLIEYETHCLKPKT